MMNKNINHSVGKNQTKSLRSFDTYSSYFDAKIKLSLTSLQNLLMISCYYRLLVFFFLVFSNTYWFTRHLYFGLGYFSFLNRLLSSIFTFWNQSITSLLLARLCLCIFIFFYELRYQQLIVFNSDKVLFQVYECTSSVLTPSQQISLAIADLLQENLNTYSSVSTILIFGFCNSFTLLDLLQLEALWVCSVLFRYNLWVDLRHELIFYLERDLMRKGRWSMRGSRFLLSYSFVIFIIKQCRYLVNSYNLQMAQRLSKVYGTEMDKVNCPFFYKIGACRYGDSCERIHNKPPISETVLLEHMYENSAVETAIISGNIVNEQDAENALNKFEQFYESIFKQMSQYGQIEDMIVVDNLGDHIVGNVYVKYSDEEYSENALNKVNGRFFHGKKISAIFSPVTDFLNAKCKQYIDGSCKRGGYCNYMHVKPLSKSFKKQLFEQMYLEHPEYKIKKRSESSDSFERRRRERRDRKDKKKRKQKQRSKSKEKKRSRSKDEKKKRKRSESSHSKDSSQERRDIIDEWNKDFYKS